MLACDEVAAKILVMSVALNSILLKTDVGLFTMLLGDIVSCLVGHGDDDVV